MIDPNVSMQVMQDDMAVLLRALGLSDHARNASPHEVMINEVIPAVRTLVEKRTPERAIPNVTDRPTLRDQFAMAALDPIATILSVAISTPGHFEITAPNGVVDPDSIAKVAYLFADAMLKAREAKS
jgi:predicted regulator of amino acid metabolism with ACT domain